LQLQAFIADFWTDASADIIDFRIMFSNYVKMLLSSSLKQSHMALLENGKPALLSN
jgi:hypothetical protein